MKKSKFLQIICIGCSLLITAELFCGCAGKQGSGKTVEAMEKKEVPALTFDFLGGEDVMPIGSFYGPMPSNYSYDGASQPDMFTDEFFCRYCGQRYQSDPAA